MESIRSMPISSTPRRPRPSRRRRPSTNETSAGQRVKKRNNLELSAKTRSREFILILCAWTGARAVLAWTGLRLNVCWYSPRLHTVHRNVGPGR